MITYINWWCDRTREKCDNQDFFFDRFFEAGCKEWQLDTNDIQVGSLFGDIRTYFFSPRAKVRIWFCGENISIPYWAQYHNEQMLESQVDIIAGFHSISSKFIRLPLWMIYWDFWSTGLWTPNPTTSRLNKAVLIASHNAHGTRTAICTMMHSQAGIKVDVNKLDLFPHADKVIQLGPTCTTKRNTVKFYKYNICPENSIAQGYNTEKLFESLYCGCVPVYWGAEFEKDVDVIKPEYICRVTSAQLPDLSTIKVPYEGGLDVWKEDALVKIYTQYAKLWVSVLNKIKSSDSKVHPSTQRVNYTVENKEEALESLHTHWKKYNHFFTPRATFEIQGQTIEWEELFNEARV